jgi:hypothetical protein
MEAYARTCAWIVCAEITQGCDAFGSLQVCRMYLDWETYMIIWIWDF